MNIYYIIYVVANYPMETNITLPCNLLPSDMLLTELCHHLDDIDYISLQLAWNQCNKRWMKKYSGGIQGAFARKLLKFGTCHVQTLVQWQVINKNEFSYILAEEGEYALLQWFIDNKYPIHKSCLSYAAKNGHMLCMKLLLAHGYTNAAAANYAAYAGQTECTKLLVDYGLKLERNQNNEAAVIAVRASNWPMLDYLLDNYADEWLILYTKNKLFEIIDKQDHFDWPQQDYLVKIILMIENRHCLDKSLINSLPLFAIELLFERIPSLFTQSSCEYAIYHNKVDILQFLVLKGFWIYERDYEIRELSHFDMAKNRNHNDMKNYLRLFGATCTPEKRYV